MTSRTSPARLELALLAALGGDLAKWSQRCHAASLAIVKSGVLTEGPARVLRGTCEGVPGQHSWVALCTAGEVYDPETDIIDPTLWCYDGTVEGIWFGHAGDRPHLPHGHGSIFGWGKPAHGGGPDIDLPAPAGGWSAGAGAFLDLVGPLDRDGWFTLLHAPMADWPAGEILEQAHRHPELAHLIEIDRLGMLTGVNPGGLYLAAPRLS